jgi:hypothetical protein
MKYDLEVLDDFIIACVDLYKPLHAETIVPEFQSREEFVTQKISAIKKDLKQLMFDAQTESRIEIIVQFHQTHIIKLADKISECLENEVNTSSGRTKAALFKLFYHRLEDLLTFIETYFSKYFDQDQKIPDAYVQLERLSFLEKLEEIKITTLSHKLDLKLTDLILQPVKNFVNATSDEDITYRRLIYLKQLLKDLQILLSDSFNADVFNEILKLLSYLNFNSRDFLIYVTGHISEEVREQISLTGQLEKLCYWLKVLNQNQVKPGFALNGNNPSFQEQVGIWLTEEISFLERKKQFTLMMPPTELVKETFKVHTIFSVPQLAYMIRLLKESGILTNKNQTELIRIFSNNFSSLRNENISAESLRIKYYNVEKPAVNSVQAFLMKMIEQSKKTKWLILFVLIEL